MVWINEFHYDDPSGDEGEFVEIGGLAGTDLTGWTIVLYNGASTSRAPYQTINLSGITPNQQNGFGTLSFDAIGIQNGGPDGLALVNAAGQVVEFISYEGSFVANGGPADGMTSTNVGTEPGSAPGTSLGRTGTGDEASDFAWTLITDDTPGGVNVGQTFGNTPPPPTPGAFSIDDAAATEGDTGSNAITFTVSRGSNSNAAASVTYTVTLPGDTGGAGADDITGTLTGTIAFAADETARTITLQVTGDTIVEGDETFTVTLSDPTDGATIADATGTGTISDNDTPPAPPQANVFINEIHYDNTGTDVGEAIEIAAPAGTDLAGWQLVLYSTSSGASTAAVYNTRALSGVVPNQENGFGAIAFTYPTNGIQNGAQDGVALVNPLGEVVQFLSYEGVIVAGDGPAAGRTSQDIGVAEEGGVAGTSLQLVGTGSTAGDFTWQAGSDASFGAVNATQDFLAGDVTGAIRIDDARVREGDAGTTQLVFTVRRAGGQDSAASVDYAVTLNGNADAADLSGALVGTVTFGVGENLAEVVINVSGDTAPEANESFTVSLSNPVGNVAIADGEATGTIQNDDPIDATIAQIQGEAHRSPLEGQVVTTTGIVTFVRSNGFYLQDPAGDGNARTSEAVFVFTQTAPAVATGDAVTVRGTVSEFQGNEAGLPITQLVSDVVTVTSNDNPLPASTLIGAGGLLPPSETIEDDSFTSFDPTTDGLDFYEALEGMRITIDAPEAIANGRGNNLYVVAAGGEGATGLNSGGGITISEGDFNPERLRLFDSSGALSGVTHGDQLGDVTGVLSYFGGDGTPQAAYELIVTEPVTITSDVALPEREETLLGGDANHLTVASYNVENLDLAEASADGSPDRFDIVAGDIVYALNAPDIIGLQEIQDANGAASGGSLSGVETAAELIERIAEIGGPDYVYVEIAPTADGSTGGQNFGNIRNGFLVNADRVDYVEGSARLIEDPAFEGSRRPLVAEFTFSRRPMPATARARRRARRCAPSSTTSLRPIPISGWACSATSMPSTSRRRWRSSRAAYSPICTTCSRRRSATPTSSTATGRRSTTCW